MVFGLCHGTRQHRKANQSRWQMDFANRYPRRNLDTTTGPRCQPKPASDIVRKAPAVHLGSPREDARAGRHARRAGVRRDRREASGHADDLVKSRNVAYYFGSLRSRRRISPPSRKRKGMPRAADRRPNVAHSPPRARPATPRRPRRPPPPRTRPRAIRPPKRGRPPRRARAARPLRWWRCCNGRAAPPFPTS